jgi:hypothetical protein
MNPSICPAAGICPPQEHCSACRSARRRSRAETIGMPAVPVRRYGQVPPPPDAVFQLEDEDDVPGTRTIGDRGARAVWAGALLAAAVAGILLYA